MKWMMSPLRTMSPLGLVTLGAVAGVAGIPILKSTARSLAVMTVKGVLVASDIVKEASESVSKSLEELKEEAMDMKTMMKDQMEETASKAANKTEQMVSGEKREDL